MGVRDARRRRREALAQLTRGERLVLNAHLLLMTTLPFIGVLLAAGTGGALRVTGIVLLGMTVVLYATPVAILVQARARRQGRG